MALVFQNLDQKTRELMLAELELDIREDNVFISNRLNDLGKSNYINALKSAISDGNDLSLTSIIQSGYLNTSEPYTRNGKLYSRRIDPNAASMLAEGEFNRYYIRALCRRVLEVEEGTLVVYRAKEVSNPRSGSESKIGTEVDSQTLLTDLRVNIGVDTALGLPAGPNSGLSVYIRRDKAHTIA